MPSNDNDAAMRQQADAALKALDPSYNDAQVREQWASRTEASIGTRVMRAGEAPLDERDYVDATKDPLDFTDAVERAEQIKMQQAVTDLGDIPAVRERLRQAQEITDALIKEGDPKSAVGQALATRAVQIRLAQGMVDDLVRKQDEAAPSISFEDKLANLDLVVRSLDDKAAA